MTSSEKRLVSDLCRGVQTHVPCADPRLTDLIRQADMLLKRLRPRAIKKTFAQPTRKEVRERRREWHAEETRTIRAAVFDRADDICELCRKADASELHHLESGPLRRKLQSIRTCLAACATCHRGYHRNPGAYADEVRYWANHHGYPIPSRFR